MSVISLDAQISQHGLLLNGGIGSVSSQTDKSKDEWTKLDYKFGLSAGYRLRFNMPTLHSFHYDIDVMAGAKFFKPYTYFNTHSGNNYASSGATPDYFTSISGTVNYTLFKNISIGFGLEPSYYFNNKLPGTYGAILNPEQGYYPGYFGSNTERKTKFDIPIVAKVSYNLKVVEIGISGKYGLTNVVQKPHSMKSGKNREIQLHLFIPFRFKK